MNRRESSWWPDITFFCIAVAIVWFVLSSTCHGEPLDTSGWRASAASTGQAEAHPAVGRICSTSGRARTYGSGTLIHKEADRGIVVTCSHLFRDGMDSVTVTFPDGKRYVAKLLGRDEAWDLAALMIAPPDMDPVPIAAQHPQLGDQLQSCGYGSDGSYWCNQGRVLGYVRTTLTSAFETLELSGRARDGDSGGPVFNVSGELVAVLWGTDGRMVGGSYCGRVRKFLAGIFASSPRGGVSSGLCPRCGRPDCANSRQQQPDCDGDGCYPQGGGGNQPLPGAIPIPIQPGPMVPVEPICDITWQIGFGEKLNAIAAQLDALELPQQGDSGERGSQGEQGLQGVQGFQGEQGPSLNLDAVVEALVERLKADQAFLEVVVGMAKGEPGPSGVAGLIHLAGCEDTTCADDCPIAALVAKLPPIYFRHIDGETGEVFAPKEPVYLGEGYEFVRWQIDWEKAAAKIAPHLPQPQGETNAP